MNRAYVTKKEDGSLLYIGEHAERPEQAFGPAIPVEFMIQDMDKFFLTYEGDGDDVVLMVDEVAKGKYIQEQADKVKALAEQEKEFKENIDAFLAIDPASLTTVDEVRDYLVAQGKFLKQVFAKTLNK